MKVMERRVARGMLPFLPAATFSSGTWKRQSELPTPWTPPYPIGMRRWARARAHRKCNTACETG
eukprot:7350438-Prymnesium_polylepis.2